MASGDPDVMYTQTSGHCNPVGVANVKQRRNPLVYSEEHVPHEVDNHAASSFGAAPGDTKSGPDMVRGANYDTGSHLMAYGHGLSNTSSHLKTVNTQARQEFRVFDWSHLRDFQADYASDAKLLEMRHQKTIDQLMREGESVPMRFPFTPIQHYNQMEINLTFSPTQMTLSEILKAVDHNDCKQLVIEMDSSRFGDQFSELAVLEPGTFHAAIHDIQLTGYQTLNMPIPLFADLQSKVPTTDQSAGFCSWISHNNLCSRMGSRQPLHLMANTSCPSCKVVCYVGDDELCCEPSWCRWSQINLKQELSALRVENGLAIIRYNSRNQTQATDPIQFEVARSFPDLKEATEEAISAGRVNMESSEEMVTVVGEVDGLQKVEVRVPTEVLYKDMQHRAALTNRARHMISFDKVRLVLTPCSENGWLDVRKYMAQRKGMGLGYADPMVSISVSLRIRLALAMRSVNNSQSDYD